jgi:hypothetical protein
MRRVVAGLATAACLLWGGHAEARRVIRCTDGHSPAFMRRQSFDLCDVDGSADGVCTFRLPTGLACIECSTTADVRVPLNGRRIVITRNPTGYFAGRLRCRRAPSATTD